MKIFQYDKMIHGTIFFFFGLFIYRAFNIFWSGISYSWARAFFTVVTVTIYGMLDEFHQHFVSGRTPDAWDATADTLGGVVAILLIYFLDKLKVNARSRI